MNIENLLYKHGENKTTRRKQNQEKGGRDTFWKHFGDTSSFILRQITLSFCIIFKSLTFKKIR